jgi:hypothetical protein
MAAGTPEAELVSKPFPERRSRFNINLNLGGGKRGGVHLQLHRGLRADQRGIIQESATMQQMIEKAVRAGRGPALHPEIPGRHRRRQIRRFSIMESEIGYRNILKDVAFMECVGLQPVIVHGGGKAVSKKMREAHIQPNFVQGLRVTDEKTIEGGRERAEQRGQPAPGGDSRELRRQSAGHPRRRHPPGQKTRTGFDPQSGEELDWGYVGKVISGGYRAGQSISKGGHHSGDHTARARRRRTSV